PDPDVSHRVPALPQHTRAVRSHHDRRQAREEPGLADEHPVVVPPGDEEDLAAGGGPGDPPEIDEARTLELQERLLARPERAVDDLLADEARGVAPDAGVRRLHGEEELRRLVACRLAAEPHGETDRQRANQILA